MINQPAVWLVHDRLLLKKLLVDSGVHKATWPGSVPGSVICFAYRAGMGYLFSILCFGLV